MYNHKEIEKKWQEFWDKNNIFKTKNDFSKPKYYCLDMFPYPSGAGLHVGHPEGYTANDIVARYKHANGFNVLHPMGWDAFGLPAENYAIKTGTHPKITTDQNISNFKKQIKALGFSYDWSREINTTDPKYYKWTQWIFLKMFEKGLAYEQDLPINYCPSCKTGLALEEVLNDFTCDRCGTKVEKRKLRQWVLAITKYADRLLGDVDNLDWPEGIKDMQRNWIGKSEGCEFEMKKAFKYDIGFVTDGEYQEIIDIKKNSKSGIYKFEKSEFVVARDNGKIVGLARLRFDEKSGKVDLGGLYVDPAYRGEKIGYELFSYLIDNSPYTQYYLDCDKGLEKYYLKFGFKNLEKIEDFQLEKLIEIHEMYEMGFSDDVLDKYIFMKYTKSHKLIDSIRVYTTRIDTVFGMTYAVLAPDHPLVEKFITPEQKELCEKYIEESKKKSDQDRTQDNKEKTGVFTGSYVINPYNNEKVPLWIADYVLGNYGTGAVMAVPAHDERDFEFAKKYDLPIKQVIATYNKLTGESEPKEGFPTRIKDCTTSIIKHPSEEKYMIENFSNGEICLLGGGVESGEDIVSSALREIEEESGLFDIKSISQVGIMVGHGFKLRKNTNCKDPDYFYLVQLNSLAGFKENLQEDNVSYKNEWWTKEEILSSNKLKSHHKKMFEIYLGGEKAFCDDGVLMNSGEFNMLNSSEARNKLTQYAIDNGFGIKKVNYKLRDWLFSRQRYWGEPIPLIHIEINDFEKLPRISDMSDVMDPNLAYVYDKKGTNKRCKNCDCGDIGCTKLIINGRTFSKVYDGLYSKIVCDYTLPLELPDVENYEPSGDGNSPLAKVESFVNIKLASNLVGKRETNTMPQWGGSCWYYLRYMDNENNEALVGNDAVNYWGEVDSYVGGAEHAVLHLLYSRFWHKFLFDIGVVPTSEPFYRLKNQGLILSYAFQRQNGGLVANDEVEEKDGKFYEIKTGDELNRIISKMSKSLKNVINPDDVIDEYGADSLRLYEMYMADFKDSAPWDSKGIVGVRRFIEKFERLFTSESKISTESDEFTMKLLNKTIKKVGIDIENYKFNTAIAQMMILVNNGLPKDENLQKEWKEKAVIILHPFAPHLAEELWERLGNKITVFNSIWPKYNEALVKDDIITIGVQILGKLRGELEIGLDEDQITILEKARNLESVKKWLEGKEIVKEIYVKGKIVNIVIK